MRRRSISASNVTGKAPGPLEVMASAKWNRLALLNALIRPTLDYPFNQQVAERIAKRLDVHWVTVYRYRQRLLGEGVATAILGRVRGFPKGSSRLSPEHDAIIEKVIRRLARGPTQLRVIDVVEEVAQRCRAKQLSTPSRGAIDRRLQRLIPAIITRRSAETAQQTATAIGTFSVRKPFDVVQIDHTLCDVFVVDDLYRTPIGRPWLSVAMDIATRTILTMPDD